MPANYDISSTERLTGLHIDGMVARRFLINYPAPPEVLQPLLPPGARLSLFDGLAWVSACVVRINNMRPSPVPEGYSVPMNSGQ
jgi:uncharacterized protein YqjF (DUF2071 family)